jgi:DMSO/TMAO reductase YedYZ molybdopterin-dependent catalytic subunit
MLVLSAWAQQAAPPKPLSGPSEFKIDGTVTTPLDLTTADLKGMPRKTLRVENPHSKKTEVYEGVLVEDLLKKAGVPQGEQLRGQAMATYVLVEAADNYRVVFALEEFNSSFQDSEIIVADTMDGAPIPGALGPFRLVVPHEKRPARWVEMLKSITIVRVP